MRIHMRLTIPFAADTTAIEASPAADRNSVTAFHHLAALSRSPTGFRNWHGTQGYMSPPRGFSYDHARYPALARTIGTLPRQPTHTATSCLAGQAKVDLLEVDLPDARAAGKCQGIL